ncbi:MAG: hypothetical protein CMQ40_03900 [Gammaproteobacteria bacterium]|nr:hypothetical protein [Gammaproteobacteria bacterium]
MANTIRNQGRNAIDLIGIHTGGRPDLQLGRLHPGKAMTRSLHGAARMPSPNLARNPARPLTEPLPVRLQTLMSYEAPSDIRKRLATGISSPGNIGRSPDNFLSFDKPRGYGMTNPDEAQEIRSGTISRTF